METETLANYGWIIIAILIFSIMLAFVTPFGDYMIGKISNAPKDVAESFGFCQHESKTAVGQKVAYDTDKHQTIINTVCNDCGEVLSKAPSGYFENHSYVDGVCSGCGYIHTHEFFNRTSAEYHEIDGNDNFHTVIAVRSCVCGETVTTETKALHTYNELGVCTLCTHRRS